MRPVRVIITGQDASDPQVLEEAKKLLAEAGYDPGIDVIIGGEELLQGIDVLPMSMTQPFDDKLFSPIYLKQEIHRDWKDREYRRPRNKRRK